MDAATFRTTFPEFGDVTVYPDAMINFWLGLAALRLNADRFADLLDYASALFVAHNIVLATRNAKSAGAIVAPIAAKSVDKVSVTYDTSAVTLENAGHWAGTSYGVQFWQLVQMAGAAGLLV